MPLGRHGWIDGRNFIDHPEHICILTERLHAVQRAATGIDRCICECEILRPDDEK